MNLIDTHTHLYAGELGPNRTELISEAINSGIKTFLMPNIDSSSINPMLDVQMQFPENCFSMMGLHPCSVKANYIQELALVEKNLAENKFCGVGEIGIDLYWDLTFKKQQEEAFEKQIEWASNLKLPVSIHSRNATDVAIKLIQKKKFQHLKGVFHCFSGNIEQACEITDMGFYLGIGGVVTFKNSGLDKVVEAVDLKYIVLETDAPYLAPAPHRGKTNIPSYLLLVAQKIASIKNMPVNYIAEQTTQNAKKIFTI